MGAPNQYGLKDGKLAPAFMFDEYLEALKFMNKCYNEGLINQDMATYSSDKWNEQFLSGKAGVIIDVADRARRLAQNIQAIDPNAVVDVDADGYVVKKDDANLTKEYNDLNQFSTGIVATKLQIKYATDVAEKIQEVYDENKLHTVANPAEPYVSDTYSTRGPQLDAIMSEANTKFIVGQISEDEWKAQRDRWLQQGGQKVIDELNKAYEEDDSVQK